MRYCGYFVKTVLDHLQKTISYVSLSRYEIIHAVIDFVHIIALLLAILTYFQEETSKWFKVSPAAITGVYMLRGELEETVCNSGCPAVPVHRRPACLEHLHEVVSCVTASWVCLFPSSLPKTFINRHCVSGVKGTICDAWLHLLLCTFSISKRTRL